MFNKNCSQKSKEVCKNRESNKKSHCNKKYPDKYRKNNRNDKLSKSSGPVGQKLDIAIHWINHYPVYKY